MMGGGGRGKLPEHVQKRQGMQKMELEKRGGSIGRGREKTKKWKRTLKEREKKKEKGQKEEEGERMERKGKDCMKKKMVSRKK